MNIVLHIADQEVCNPIDEVLEKLKLADDRNPPN